MRLICKLLFPTLLYICVLGCTTSNDTSLSLDIKEGLSGEININLDSVYSCHDLISLKSQDKYLLTKIPSIVYTDDKNFIISSDDHVYLYGSDGSFSREIGKYGKGHGEHGKITSCFYDKKNKYIYICSFGGQIYCYSLEGEYINKILVKNKEKGSVTRAFGLVGDSKIVGIKNVYADGDFQCYATIYDERGNAEKDCLLYSDDLSFRLTTESFPIIYSTGDSLKVKLPFDNRLFSISRNGDVKCDGFDLGELSPSRDLIENCENRKELCEEKCQILDIKETSKHLYVICYSDMKYHSLILDKVTKRVIFSNSTNNPKEKGALSYTEGSVNFWPSFCAGNKMFCLIAMDDVYSDKKCSTADESGFCILKIQEK